MTSELKPCPFCGGDAIFENEHPMYESRMFIGCGECNAEVEPLDSSNYSKIDQISLWNTRALPDVPELVTVGHLWEYAEYYRDDRGYYGYVKIITEENPSTHVSPASKIRHHRELVARDQAAEIIAAKDKEIAKLKRWVKEEAEECRHQATDCLDNQLCAEAAEAKLAQYEAQQAAPAEDLKAENEKLREAAQSMVAAFDPYNELKSPEQFNAYHDLKAALNVESSNDKEAEN